MSKNIVGTWKLKSCVVKNTKDINDNCIFPYGKESSGQLMYNSDGYMSVIISENQRENLKFEKGYDIENASDEEKLKICMNFVSYCGRYELVENNQIHHTVENSFLPNYIGNNLIRYFEFNQNALILTTPEFKIDKKVYKVVSSWEKVS